MIVISVENILLQNVPLYDSFCSAGWLLGVWSLLGVSQFHLDSAHSAMYFEAIQSHGSRVLFGR